MQKNSVYVTVEFHGLADRTWLSLARLHPPHVPVTALVSHSRGLTLQTNKHVFWNLVASTVKSLLSYPNTQHHKSSAVLRKVAGLWTASVDKLIYSSHLSLSLSLFLPTSFAIERIPQSQAAHKVINQLRQLTTSLIIDFMKSKYIHFLSNSQVTKFGGCNLIDKLQVFARFTCNLLFL